MVLFSIPNEKTLPSDVNPNATTISAFEQLVHKCTVEDDKEADAIQESIDQRRKNRREAKLKEEIKITEQFSDLKRKLHTLSADEWDSIPENGDYSLRNNKKKKFESFVPITDTLLEKAKEEKELFMASNPNSKTAGGSETPMTDLTAVGERRVTELSQKLDRLSESVSRQTVVDPKAYLTDLKSMKRTTAKEIHDRNRARLLYKGLTQSNPNYPNGWIAAARVEEMDGKIKAARFQIQRACKECPKNEDVWLEACRLANPEDAKAVIARGVKLIPNSVELWLEAAKLEQDKEIKSRVLRKALEHITDSVRLWEAAVELANEEDARILLHRAVECCPLHLELWLEAAKLEHDNENKSKVLRKGLEHITDSVRLWQAAVEVANEEDARILLHRAVECCPLHLELWLEAAKLEHDKENKSKVLRKGLEHIPDSVRLWEALAELANEEDARILLNRAVECCPLNLDLWLALARFETYENSKKVLNEARQKFPKEPAIWITAAKVEEANGNPAMVGKIIDRGIKTLQREEVVIDRVNWINEAEASERAGCVAICQAIIKNTIGIGVEEEDRKRTWVADAEECKKRGSIETARAIYAHALTVFLTKKSIWLRAAQLEKSHGSRESLDALLRKAVTYVPQAEVLWLAKEKCLAGDVPAARTILQEAYAAFPNSEKIWIAAFKLEFENEEPERPTMLLAKARVWMKSAIVERELGNVEEERRLLDEGLKQFPTFFKLWLMLGQLEERFKHLEQAKKAYDSGLRHCPHCIPLWLSRANFEEKVNGLKRARAVLSVARKKNPQEAELWLAAIRTELRHDNEEKAKHLMAKALQECPNSGILLAADIEMTPRLRRETKSMDAIKKCNHDPHVTAAVAKLYWQDKKVEKARSWFKRTVTLAPNIGDFWALYYKFELQHGLEEYQKEVLARCVASEPKHGEKWQAISKAVENGHQPIEVILERVVIAFIKEEKGA